MYLRYVVDEVLYFVENLKLLWAKIEKKIVNICCFEFLETIYLFKKYCNTVNLKNTVFRFSRRYFLDFFFINIKINKFKIFLKRESTKFTNYSERSFSSCYHEPCNTKFTLNF